MAPRETPKVSSKVQRTIVKTSTTKTKTMSVTTLKKTTTTVKKPLVQISDTTPKQNKVTVNPRRTTTVQKENKTVPAPGSVIKSAKKSTWNRRPKPAHSGVPVPEKMKKYFEKRLQEFECSF